MPNAKLTQYFLLFSGAASHVYRSINGLVRLCLASTHEADTYFGAKKKGTYLNLCWKWLRKWQGGNVLLLRSR